MLEKELETAIELAAKAGVSILEFYALEIVAEEKLGVDNFSEPVTIADKTASKIIVKGLAEAFPEDGILSEEEDDLIEIRTSRNRVWMIDPIDGTWGFIKKDGDFGVQIGLTIGSEVVLGIVFLPAQNALYYAVKNEGAFLIENGEKPKRLQVSGKTNFTEMNLASSRNHRSPRMFRIIEDFGFKQEIQRGSVGLKVGLVTEQICDLYIHLSPRTKFWDTCAPQIILEESGGRMTDLYGFPINYNLSDVQNHNGVLASNGVSHDAAVVNLKPLLNEFGRLRVKAANKI
ncbi:MAG: 3'(2'),5'-bisphosphate nucleotidase CysQ [Acidobacteria bacterium]|nr:3'(2'),5'-bisphosphate nucleotidase CysQ [Acidobacteriota bacterium]MCA1639154.1 3'(2'),5'-bisphosphate nucleotidase CysQ [Acidobacteriota bacterium]